MTKIWVLVLIYLAPSQQHFSEVKLYAMQDELMCRKVAAGPGYPNAIIKTCQEIEAPPTTGR